MCFKHDPFVSEPDFWGRGPSSSKLSLGRSRGVFDRLGLSFGGLVTTLYHRYVQACRCGCLRRFLCFCLMGWVTLFALLQGGA